MKRVLFVILIYVLMVIPGLVVNAEEGETPTEDFYTGVEEMTAEELEAFHNTLPKIVDVKPNRIALSRFSEEESVLFENVEVAEIGEEMVYAIPGEDVSLMSTTTVFELKPEVDVSGSLTFPPVADQGQNGSCLPWAMCYYQLTNNHCLVNGLAAKTKTGDAIDENIMAPGFVYSLCNGGVNGPTRLDDVAETLVDYGCPNADNYDLEITEDSLKKWCTDTDVWYDAMYNKPKGISYIKIDTSQVINKDSNCVELIKRELANGYVLTFGTRAKDFELTTKITSNLDGTEIKEYGCRFQNGNLLSKGHFMTIVGYDDTFWIDVNDNGKDDEGELGAFKIMNSAGQRVTEYKTGYIWMAYDALGAISGVANAPTNRYPAMKDAVYCIEAQKNYTPLLVAEVEITTANREYIYSTFNVLSDKDNELEYLLPTSINETIPTILYSWKDELDVEREAVNFLGTIGEATIIVPFDLTRIICSELETVVPGTTVRVYTCVEDGNADDGLPVSYNLVRIVEPITGKTVNYTDGVTSVLGWSENVQYVDFQITPFIRVNNEQNITLEFNSNVKSALINENIYLITPKNEMIYTDCEFIDNKIIVHCPNDGYDYNAKYELHVTKDVISKGGNSLKQEVEIPIYIATDVTMIRLLEER